MADNECREADCAHWLGRNLGCEYPDLDGCRTRLVGEKEV